MDLISEDTYMGIDRQMVDNRMNFVTPVAEILLFENNFII